jgi:biopolymer transport protein ExbB
MKAKQQFTGRRQSLWLALMVLATALAPQLLAAQTEDAAAPPAEAANVAANAAPEDAQMIPTKNMLQVLRDGGPFMIPIIACSMFLMVFVFERLIVLRRPRVIPRPFVKRFLEQLSEGQLDRESALAACAENKSPVAEVFAAAVKKWGRPAVEVEQAIIDAGERVTNGLRRYLRLFNGIATISPLLGLLGTVTGMIAAFNVIAKASAMGRPEMLAAGISEALLTTAAGLVVAIPALSAYLYFVGRVDTLVIELDSWAQKVVDHISAEALQNENAKSKRKAA